MALIFCMPFDLSLGPGSRRSSLTISISLKLVDTHCTHTHNDTHTLACRVTVEHMHPYLCMYSDVCVPFTPKIFMQMHLKHFKSAFAVQFA